MRPRPNRASVHSEGVRRRYDPLSNVHRDYRARESGAPARPQGPVDLPNTRCRRTACCRERRVIAFPFHPDTLLLNRVTPLCMRVGIPGLRRQWCREASRSQETKPTIAAILSALLLSLSTYDFRSSLLEAGFDRRSD